jgi:hypothetical protein
MTAPAVRVPTVPRPILLALYVVAVAFALPSLLEFALLSYPYEFGSPQRRFGAIGLIFNSVMFSPIVGILVAVFASLQLGHRRVTRSLAILAFVIAALLIIAAPFFVLDFLQLRAQVVPQAKRAFDWTSAKASFTGALMCLTVLAIGIGAWRSSGTGAQQPVAARAPRKGGVIVGDPAPAATMPPARAPQA